jgi:hypothetical protein
VVREGDGQSVIIGGAVDIQAETRFVGSSLTVVGVIKVVSGGHKSVPGVISTFPDVNES